MKREHNKENIYLSYSYFYLTTWQLHFSIVIIPFNFNNYVNSKLFNYLH